MILHIAPDYFNATLYPRLVEAQQTHFPALGYFVYACDNAPHDANAVPVEDIRYIANRILTIHNCYDEMSKRCLENVQQFNWPSIAATYNEIYQYIITHK